MTVYLLHNIGEKLNSNYNTPEEIIASPADAVLTFDGIYQNVWEHRAILEGRQVELFVMGDYVGKDNAFDVGMPPERYCDWNQLMDLVVQLRAELGWHTWSHRDLTKLSDSELEREVTPPFPMRAFAYPYGIFDERVVEAVQGAGFESAYSVFQDGAGVYSLRRQYL